MGNATVIKNKEGYTYKMNNLESDDTHTRLKKDPTVTTERNSVAKSLSVAG